MSCSIYLNPQLPSQPRPEDTYDDLRILAAAHLQQDSKMDTKQVISPSVFEVDVQQFQSVQSATGRKLCLGTLRFNKPQNKRVFYCHALHFILIDANPIDANPVDPNQAGDSSQHTVTLVANNDEVTIMHNPGKDIGKDTMTSEYSFSCEEVKHESATTVVYSLMLLVLVQTEPRQMLVLLQPTRV